jgi:hypothetical protein
MLTKIILVVLFLILCYTISKILNPANTISKMNNGWEENVVDIKKLNKNINSTNFTYSLWFHVKDWNSRYGDEKCLLRRGGSNNSAVESPKITLGAMQNDIDIKMQVMNSTASGNDNICSVKNFPLQKWINLAISLQNRTLDIYIDGKLHKTCLLDGVPKIPKTSNIYITPDGGFNGWTANFQYWDGASNPQQIYDIYKKGYGGGALGNIFNKYKVRFQLLKNNEVSGEIEI